MLAAGGDVMNFMMVAKGEDAGSLVPSTSSDWFNCQSEEDSPRVVVVSGPNQGPGSDA